VSADTSLLLLASMLRACVLRHAPAPAPAPAAKTVLEHRRGFAYADCVCGVCCQTSVCQAGSV